MIKTKQICYDSVNSCKIIFKRNQSQNCVAYHANDFFLKNYTCNNFLFFDLISKYIYLKNLLMNSSSVKKQNLVN